MKNLSDFIEWLRDRGYVVASTSNDPESTQDLHECFYVEELIKEFESETNNKHDQ